MRAIRASLRHTPRARWRRSTLIGGAPDPPPGAPPALQEVPEGRTLSVRVGPTTISPPTTSARWLARPPHWYGTRGWGRLGAWDAPSLLRVVTHVWACGREPRSPSDWPVCCCRARSRLITYALARNFLLDQRDEAVLDGAVSNASTLQQRLLTPRADLKSELSRVPPEAERLRRPLLRRQLVRRERRWSGPVSRFPARPSRRHARSGRPATVHRARRRPDDGRRASTCPASVRPTSKRSP